MKRSKHFLFLSLMLLLWIPIVQQLTGFFAEPKLKGAFIVPTKPVFSADSLKTFQYQKQVEDYLNNTFGFRGLFVKIKNSWEYLLFNQINIEDQIEGKNGYIYSKCSIELMLGKWYNGSIKNENILTKINFLKENVEKRGGHFLVLFAPSKESVLPEYLPTRYYGQHADSSNYKDFIAGYKKYNIPFIDFSDYFNKIKATTAHPLFTKTGFHWSSFAASVAQDTLLKYMQNVLKDTMPHYKRIGVEWSDTARGSEADFEDPMNLFFSLNQTRYVYPKLEMVASTLKNKRPKVIIIGDSFFWQIKNLTMLRYIFSDDSKFWYYFAQHSIPLSDAAGVLMSDINIMEDLLTADYIILVGSFGTTGNFPFGVTDYFIKNLSVPGVFGNIREYIKNKPVWVEQLTKEAQLQNKTVNECITDEAKRIFRNKSSFNLKARNGNYVCAEASRADIVTADKEHASSWELFSLFQVDENNCVITSFQDKFLSADIGSKGEVTINRIKIGPWEIFKIEKLENDFVAIKASNGKYLSLDEKTMLLFANGNSIGEMEKFKLITQ